MYTVPARVRSTHNQDGGVALDIQQGQIFNFNLVGSRIFELLKDGVPEIKVIETISQEFAVRPALAAADVREFLKTLQEQRLVDAHEQL